MIKHLPVILAVGLSALWTSGASIASATVAAAPIEHAAPVAPVAPVPMLVPMTVPVAPLAAPVAPVAPAAVAPPVASALWQGEVRRAANVRREPNTHAAIVREVTPGTPVTVQRWVLGEAVD